MLSDCSMALPFGRWRKTTLKCHRLEVVDFKVWVAKGGLVPKEDDVVVVP